jgi:predicted nucleotidyltransferase component of viral defense system
VDHSYYCDHLYPLQDAVLRVLSATETGFYLSGGTAVSRAYLRHRFSEGLDLFVNDDPSFGLWAARRGTGSPASTSLRPEG